MAQRFVEIVAHLQGPAPQDMNARMRLLAKLEHETTALRALGVSAGIEMSQTDMAGRASFADSVSSEKVLPMHEAFQAWIVTLLRAGCEPASESGFWPAPQSEPTHEWNTYTSDDGGLYVCRGEHKPNDACMRELVAEPHVFALLRAGMKLPSTRSPLLKALVADRRPPVWETRIGHKGA